MYDPRDIVPLQPTVMMREGGMVSSRPHIFNPSPPTNTLTTTSGLYRALELKKQFYQRYRRSIRHEY